MYDDAADAWGDIEETGKQAGSDKTTAAAFDDQGEPDFEGWLNAQAQAKTKSKTQLPKGLSRPKAGVVTSSRSGSAAGGVSAKTIPSSKPSSKGVVAVPSKPTPATTAVDEDDDWGEAWG